MRGSFSVLQAVDDLTPLLVAAAGGDRRALDELITRSQPEVRRFCASLLDPASADDATQDTYLRVWRSAKGFRAEASARTWLFAIARRVCYDQVKRQRRRPETVPLADRPTEDPTGASDLSELVRRLDPDRRAAFVLTQVHGLSYQQAADVCGCPIGTIRSRVARARAELLEACGDG
jgi:RNA polymerase sigma-70 factor (ECF subfamily)